MFRFFVKNKSDDVNDVEFELRNVYGTILLEVNGKSLLVFDRSGSVRMAYSESVGTPDYSTLGTLTLRHGSHFIKYKE